ncbi:S41 family peptidase [Dysgonomonas sp. 216]|uniref:S41 family peptidase n=1 Tax=Dysgonomonas sp. 216 TaxID=2302934 RepID=UPI0013D067E5|nr:S41 family peptidase [Dysgonomonas sp. 216]NDW19772.1 S41 family peptidase [Dysgonomonas sp. 216]
MRSYKRKNTSVWLPLWITLGIAIGILIGNVFSNFNSRRSLFNRGDKLEAILEYINDAYVDTVDIQELVEDAIPEIIAGLDPHSVYISAKDMEIVGDDLEGHFSGIGVQFIMQRDTVVVVSIIQGGPSEAAGVRAGDRIVYVNDSLFAGNSMTNEKVMRQLRGKTGTSVKLGVKRLSSQGIVDIKVTRASIPVNTVDVSFVASDKVGYIKVNKFGSTTYSEFISAISKLKNQQCESFVIDLRQNTGGYLNAAIDMVGEFLAGNQLVVYTEGRAFPRQDYLAKQSGACKTDQIVVLIDEGSASASEIFAGAIQDNDRGLIIGRRSFGKGLVQGQRQFKDKSALRLTVARYHTPSGRCIQKAYERGNSDDYNQDILRRFQRGEFDSEDSIKLENYPLFHTVGGRPVYGDDGIMPDIFIPRDTVGVNSYYTRVANQGLIYEYSFMYTDMHRERLSKFKNWQELSSHLQKQPLVLNLVSYAESKGIRQRPYLINESRTLMQTQMEAYIVRNIFGDDGYYQVLLRDDIVLKRAVDLVNKNKALPENVKTKGYLSSALQLGVLPQDFIQLPFLRRENIS